MVYEYRRESSFLLNMYVAVTSAAHNVVKLVIHYMYKIRIALLSCLCVWCWGTHGFTFDMLVPVHFVFSAYQGESYTPKVDVDKDARVVAPVEDT